MVVAAGNLNFSHLDYFHDNYSDVNGKEKKSNLIRILSLKSEIHTFDRRGFDMLELSNIRISIIRIKTNNC
jgi:hypothetical protein